MEVPKIAQKAPYAVAVEAGKTYYWCSCGLTTNQPFCDGAHKPTSFKPVVHEAQADGTVYFCGCKQSGNGALCDGAHKGL
jgi:CDGSH iron-sulfur domain-containing protein 3